MSLFLVEAVALDGSRTSVNVEASDGWQAILEAGRRGDIPLNVRGVTVSLIPYVG